MVINLRFFDYVSVCVGNQTHFGLCGTQGLTFWSDPTMEACITKHHLVPIHVSSSSLAFPD